jgi:hypothetical protein
MYCNLLDMRPHPPSLWFLGALAVMIRLHEYSRSAVSRRYENSTEYRLQSHYQLPLLASNASIKAMTTQGAIPRLVSVQVPDLL